MGAPRIRREFQNSAATSYCELTLIHDTTLVIRRDELRCATSSKSHLADQTDTQSLLRDARVSYPRVGLCVATMGHEFIGNRRASLHAVVEASALMALDHYELSRAVSSSSVRADRIGPSASPRSPPASATAHVRTWFSRRNVVPIAAAVSAPESRPAIGAPERAPGLQARERYRARAPVAPRRGRSHSVAGEPRRDTRGRPGVRAIGLPRIE